MENDLEKITKLEFEELSGRLLRKGIRAEFDQSAAKLIAKESDKAEQGARGIKKMMQKMIESAISQKILANEINNGSLIKISAENGKIIIDKL